MSRWSWIYALFCIAVLALFTLAAMRGYSPFASGGARGFGGVYGYARGPVHK